jgi:hypothetical protein
MLAHSFDTMCVWADQKAVKTGRSRRMQNYASIVPLRSLLLAVAVYQERRRHIIARYGGRCVCCGETEIGFLTIDHVANDGAAHRKLNMRAMRLAYFITRNGYPPDFQVLCYNCNCAKGALGECPHLKKVPMGM